MIIQWPSYLCFDAHKYYSTQWVSLHKRWDIKKYVMLGGVMENKKKMEEKDTRKYCCL